MLVNAGRHRYLETAARLFMNEIVDRNTPNNVWRPYIGGRDLEYEDYFLNARVVVQTRSSKIRNVIQASADYFVRANPGRGRG